MLLKKRRDRAVMGRAPLKNNTVYFTFRGAKQHAQVGIDLISGELKSGVEPGKNPAQPRPGLLPQTEFLDQCAVFENVFLRIVA